MAQDPENSKFYIYEEIEDENKRSNEGALKVPKTRDSIKSNRGKGSLKLETKLDKYREFSAASTIEMTSTESLLSYKENLNNFENILKFPIESSHAYSYAHLSQNSLALRLNVLKRSIEILKDRPGLLKSIQKGQEDIEDHVSVQSRMASHTYGSPQETRHSFYLHSSANNSQEQFNDKYKMQSNASSAALAALFRPQMKRSDSLPINQLYSNKEDSPLKKTQSSSSPFLNDDLEDIITLLQEDENRMMDNSEIVSTLHNISLSTNKSDQLPRQDLIKNKLLYALSTPFVESAGITSSLLGESSEPISAVPSALNMINPSTPQMSSAGNRPFHAIYSGKHTLPPSIFTIETDNPWSIKAANDLACLMFGVSKNTIKALTIMDLIAPQFRNFVFEKLSGYFIDKSLRYTNHEDSRNNIIFAGEIVAISRRGDNDFAWTSMWAKKRGNLIICMFDQIPCDAFDVVLTGKESDECLSVKSTRNVAGELLDNDNLSKYQSISDISEAMDNDARVTEESVDENMSATFRCEKLNKARYYTLQLNDIENIPCAVTSYPLEEKDDSYELKLRVHSLPYIAGIFVLDAKTLKMLSWNNAIAKNLFGRGTQDLQDESINYLIPKFEKILKIGLEDYQGEFDLTPGLVLPEHFFRRYDALLQYMEGKKSSHEDIFFNSHGVKGTHRDGKAIYVDIQLRVSSSDIFVLWITYSRSSNKNNISNELDKLSSKKNLSFKDLSDPRKIRRRSISHAFKANGVKLPSQLKLFSPDNERDVEYAPSGNEINRKSSTRKPKSETLGIPISKFNNSGNIMTAVKSLRLRDVSNSSDANTSHTSRRSFADSDATSVSDDESLNDRGSALDYRYAPYIKYSEDEILKLENEELSEKLKKSEKWPREVGAHRRTKKFGEFRVLQDMGEGAYGKVVLAQHKEDDEYKVIIKCIDKERILVDTWMRDRRLGTIPSEIQIMAFLNNEPHPNIMRILDFFEDPKYYYLETPIFGDPPAIDLFDYIEIKKDMTEMECRFIFKQIVSAVYHLHKHGIVHRDIKDENVIVDENGVIKLIDFGSAGYIKSGPFDLFVGTIDYASPEVLRGEKYEGKPQDIWALGILLYTMLYKENPFYNVDEIMEGDLRHPFIISEGSTKLINKILVRETKERPSITDIVEDEWLDI